MIASILSSTNTFAAVAYNTSKIEKGDGELMKINNMPFDENSGISPEEVKTYLKAFSKSNIKNPQFHVSLSCKGREMNKEELTDFAIKYMEGMGYGEQPYIIVFHRDTENNHVHVVSSRVNVNGKKINDSFERFRSKRLINNILNLEKKEDSVLKNLLKYKVSTLSQLEHLLKSKGYHLSEKEGFLLISKEGFSKKTIDKGSIIFENGEVNKKQLKAIFNKYLKEYSNELIPIHQKLKGGRKGDIIGYHSEFSNFLKDKFGYEFIFHFKDDKEPFGYTLIDHKNQQVLKGSEVYALKVLFSKENKAKRESKEKIKDFSNFNIESKKHQKILALYYKTPIAEIKKNNNQVTNSDIELTKKMITSFLEKDSMYNLYKIGLIPIKVEGELFLIDKKMEMIYEAEQVLNKDLQEDLGMTLASEQDNKGIDLEIGWDLGNDVDDSLVHGKERNKKNRKI